MKHTIFNRFSLGLGAILVAAVAGLTATPAMAAETQSDQPPCSAPKLSQLFLSYNDTGWYALLAGETTNSFDGGGWKLGGGAQIVTTKLIDGHVGHVLDLPSGSIAASPLVCVSSSFTTARTMMHTLSRQRRRRVRLRLLCRLGRPGRSAKPRADQRQRHRLDGLRSAQPSVGHSRRLAASAVHARSPRYAQRVSALQLWPRPADEIGRS